MYICDCSPTDADVGVATVQGTAAPTAAMGIATVHNNRKVPFFFLKWVLRQFITVAIPVTNFKKYSLRHF